MSDRWSIVFFPRACSGDMYAGEPSIIPERVLSASTFVSGSSRTLATPKSRSFTTIS